MSIRSITSRAGQRADIRPSLAHDHSQCIRMALSQAERVCAAEGARLTPLRHRVLELVWASHRPLGAYDLLDQLSKEGHKPAPPTIYRALDFLLEHKLIHRLATLNAYLGCSHPGEAHGGFFLICQDCGTVEEVRDPLPLSAAVEKLAGQARFQVSQSVLEVTGRCQACQS